MKVDMSPKAITVRLKRASQLRKLCLSLGKAKPIKEVSAEEGKSDPSVQSKQNKQ